MMVKEKKDQVLLIFCVMGLMLAGLAGLAEHVQWLASLCSSFSERMPGNRAVHPARTPSLALGSGLLHRGRRAHLLPQAAAALAGGRRFRDRTGPDVDHVQSEHPVHLLSGEFSCGLAAGAVLLRKGQVLANACTVSSGAAAFLRGGPARRRGGRVTGGRARAGDCCQRGGP